MKTGLVLEGGAMRGMFTAGVIDVMMENKISFDGAIGVSAGAAFGCNYKSEQIGRVIRYNTKFCRDKRYSGIRVLIKDGNIYSKSFCYGDVPLKYDKFDFDTFNKNPMEFYVVCTDIETGKPVYHKYTGFNDHGFEWIRASASMPLVSQIVEIDNMKLLDGGISDSIPLKYFESIGYRKNIVVLTQPEDYIKGKNKILPLLKLKYRKYPNFTDTIKNRHIMYNETLEYIKNQEKNKNCLVIRPKSAILLGSVEKNPDKLREVYESGIKIACERINEIVDFVGNNANK